MFVSQRRFNELQRKFIALDEANDRLIEKWNAVCKEINAKGGDAFLKHGVLPSEVPSPFDQTTINKLIRLCHPDKHNNSPVSTEMTQLLLSMRDK